MTTTTTTVMTDQVKTVYDADYLIAVQANVYHDQFCYPRQVDNGMKGRTYEFPILESQQPSTSVLTETEDVVPQSMASDAVVITLNEYGGAIELSRFLAATSYADVYEQAAYANGYNMAESIDFIARAVMGQGSRVIFQNGRTARSQIDGQATAADRVTPAFISKLVTYARHNMPLYPDGSVCAIIHPFLLHDLLQDSGIKDMAVRTAPDLLFNGELAYWGGMRFIVSKNAKSFWGQGAAAASSTITTLASAAAVGATNIKVADVTNFAVGNLLAIRDAAEAANTWSDTNELVYVTAVGTASAAGTGVDFWALDAGPGNDGGLRYAHASGTAVNDSNSVFPIMIVGPQSVQKGYSSFTGPYGESIVAGPFDHLQRFLSVGWYGIMGFTRTRVPWLLRGECGSSLS
jgi:N4-gp56 family major capsid protein